MLTACTILACFFLGAAFVFFTLALANIWHFVADIAAKLTWLGLLLLAVACSFSIYFPTTIH